MSIQEFVKCFSPFVKIKNRPKTKTELNKKKIGKINVSITKKVNDKLKNYLIKESKEYQYTFKKNLLDFPKKIGDILEKEKKNI